MAPADDRRSIGMVGEQGRLHRLVQLRVRIGVAMHAPLLHHHFALGRDDLVGQDEAGHAVGLELHHRAQMLLGDALEIGGVIVAGERVLLAADLRDGFREGALRMRLGALEHQMFEKMRDARLAWRIVGRTVAVPDHVGDDRRATVRDDDDGQSVVEFEIDDADAGRGRGAGGAWGQAGRGGGGKRHHSFIVCRDRNLFRAARSHIERLSAIRQSGERGRQACWDAFFWLGGLLSLRHPRGMLAFGPVAALAGTEPPSPSRGKGTPQLVIARSACDEAIQGPRDAAPGLLRCARNDGCGVGSFVSGRRLSNAVRRPPRPGE